MAKKSETSGPDDSKEKEELATQKIEERVEKKVEAAPDPSKAVNIIGDIEKPDPSDKEDVKSYFKKIDAKLDQLLNPKKEKLENKKDIPEPETMPKHEEPKHVPWYEREFI